MKNLFKGWRSARWVKTMLVFLAIFGPATITAMADNDASGVATYSIAGAQLGYPILFLLVIITVFLGITQEMGMRLTLITRRGLADLIREQYGVRAAVLIFTSLIVANLGTIIVDMAAVKTTAGMLNIPAWPAIVVMVVVTFVFITKGNYRLTQGIMLVSSLFYLAYIISAVQAKPDWGLAIGNLFFPHGVQFTPAYWKNYLIIGMGVLGGLTAAAIAEFFPRIILR